MSTALPATYWIADPAIPLPFRTEVMADIGPLRIERCGGITNNRPDFTLDRWAIRLLDRCYSRDGEWVHEPLPSERSFDEAWLGKHRYTLAEALKVVGASLA